MAILLAIGLLQLNAIAQDERISAMLEACDKLIKEKEFAKALDTIEPGWKSQDKLGWKERISILARKAKCELTLDRYSELKDTLKCYFMHFNDIPNGNEEYHVLFLWYSMLYFENVGKIHEMCRLGMFILSNYTETDLDITRRVHKALVEYYLLILDVKKSGKAIAFDPQLDNSAQHTYSKMISNAYFYYTVDDRNLYEASTKLPLQNIESIVDMYDRIRLNIIYHLDKIKYNNDIKQKIRSIEILQNLLNDSKLRRSYCVVMIHTELMKYYSNGGNWDKFDEHHKKCLNYIDSEFKYTDDYKYYANAVRHSILTKFNRNNNTPSKPRIVGDIKTIADVIKSFE